MISITRTSDFSGITRTREFDLTPEQVEQFNSGVHIQKVFFNLSADDREFILTGITAEEWDEAFLEDEEN